MKCWDFQLYLVLFECLCFSIVHCNNETCGRPNNFLDRIVHGRDVGGVKYPWFATLLVANSRNRLMCGGSLISPRHILTAAHCFKPYLASVAKGARTLEEIYSIKLGVNNICKEENSQVLFSVTKVQIHEKYQDFMPYYDIAIMELDRDTNFTPICLPTIKYDDTTRPVDGLIVGLGKESSHSYRLPCTLKEARILTYNETVCKDMLTSMDQDSSKLVNAFCGGYLSGGIDSCQGDSGGPFQGINKNDRYELLGLTSFGFGCAVKGVLGVYTDVSHYLDWIYGKIDPESRNTELTTPPPKPDSYTIEEEEFYIANSTTLPPNTPPTALPSTTPPPTTPPPTTPPPTAPPSPITVAEATSESVSDNSAKETLPRKVIHKRKRFRTQKRRKYLLEDLLNF